MVVVRVNTQCSLGCRYCGFSRELPRKDRVISPSVLQSLGDFLSVLKCESQQQILVSWLGGEPFQWPGLMEWSARFVQEFGLHVSITTNGLALANDILREQSLKWFDEITLSIDGDKPFHDSIRKMPGLYDRLDTIVRRLREERSTGIPRLRVNCVLVHQNIRRFGEFCQTMKEWGFDELTFNALGGNDRPDYYRQNRLQPEDIQWLVNALPSIRQRSFPLQIRGSSEYLRRFESTAKGEPIPVSDCRPGQRFLFVDEHGQVGPCSFTVGKLGLSISELNTDLQRLQSALSILVQSRALACCTDCHATHVFEKFESST